MKRVVITLLVILFFFLAYLEATAQEIMPVNVAPEQAKITIAEPDISQSIDFGLATICECEGGRFTRVDKNIPECDFTNVEHN